MPNLKKDISLSGLTMIAIGACIGSGIFITPSGTFKYLPHHGYVLIAWFIGGVVTFLGALTFSELSASYPKSGGVYVFLKEAYGDLVGFLYGWIILLIVNTGALAALSVGFTYFLEFIIPMSAFTKQMVAISSIVILTFINVIGVRISDIFAKVFTGLKLLALVTVVFLGLYHFLTSDITQELNFNLTDVPKDISQMMLLAFVGVFWSFGGWHHATYLSGEIVNPKKTIPRAMLIGTMTVTIVYMLVILAYSVLLPLEQIVVSERVAGDAVGNVLANGGKLVAVAITVSIFGTIGIYTMSAPRIYYAMAKDGLFFKSLALLHPKYGTPYLAMLFQGCWAIILILVFNSFENLMTFATFMDIVFMTLATSTIFIFRNRQKNESRLLVNSKGSQDFMINSDTEEQPFRIRWYPLIPILYLIVTIAFVVNTVLGMKMVTLSGLAILLLGIPVYYIFKNMNIEITKE